MKLSRKICSIFALASSLFASDITPQTNHITAFALPEDMITIDGRFNYLDNDFDIFHTISKNAKHDYGYIGALSGTDLTIGYGIHKHISIFYNIKASKMDYLNSTLTNIHNEIFTRINFYDVPSYIFDDFSLDLGLIRDSSDDLSIADANYFVYFTRLLKPGLGGISQANGNLLYKGEVLSNQIDPANGQHINAKYKIKDLANNSAYLRFLWGNRFSNALLNVYTGIKYSDISTTISPSPKSSQNTRYKQFLNSFGKEVDLGRSERSIFAGANFILETQNFIYDFNYEYDRVFDRGSLSEGSNHNNILDINIAYKANESILIYLGGRIMLNNYNNVIPYLFNRYTQEKFNDRYGYVNIGFVYNFSIDSLRNQNFLYLQ